MAGRAPVLPPLADYATSRRDLLGPCEDRGATLAWVPHPMPGPDGSTIGIDVARFGAPPGRARAVVVVASGTHGVEGHAGSGLQSMVVTSGRLDRLPADVAVVIVHAVNPFGMAWSRRVDHDNIDVNRNFVDFDGPLPDSPHYASLDPLLNPADPTFDLADSSWQDALWARADDLGATELFRAVSGGQYDFPRGVQYGGRHESWSARALRAVWDEHCRDAEEVLHLDVHTGLGPCGQLTIFQTADSDDASAHVASRHFPIVVRSDRPGTADPVSHGVLGPGMEHALAGGSAPAALVVPIVVEFGTLDAPQVLAAMRADNWLHHHGDPASELGQAIRASTRDAFFIEDAAWRERVAEDGMASVHAALDAAEEADPANQVSSL
ncbi:MAG: DUF2817 domain-containing protein [Acidimicrobiales bacterium]|nr:DUF2817 domain-containing protein [Acidimicrobiales bacterium]